MYKYNSKEISQGDIFICLPGGEKYIEEAKTRGAKSVINMTRAEMADFANKLFNYPSQKLTVIGITGTNGKTTTTHLIAQGLETAGFKPAILGTLNARLTTPESLDILALMADHLANGGTHFVMEVSSHGIDQGRVAGIDFAVKILTNITQDHLDYHKTFENYRDTKLGFMKTGDGIKIYPEDYQKVELDFKNPLIGKFNQYNMQAAVLALTSLKIDNEIIKQAMSKAKAPAGRFENIDEGQPFLVIVDYAHTPDGLLNILEEAKQIATIKKGQLITVFGCGGDRDRTKRPKMGKIAYDFSDYFIITLDNPRSENIEQINSDILLGIPKTAPHGELILDRKTAIKTAINKAKANDIVILAGKGHENYQILKTGKIHFDDREEARLALNELGFKK